MISQEFSFLELIRANPEPLRISAFSIHSRCNRDCGVPQHSSFIISFPRRIPLHCYPMNRHRGFIFFFGTRRIVSGAGGDAPATCPRCRQNVTMLGKGVRRWFTLFFIPVIPLGAKQTFSQCSNCGAQFKGTPQQLGKQTAASGERQMQQAIQMYNSMRNSPQNSVTLNNLLILYMSLREFDQALSAANEF